jgi:hypothetical protein
MDKVTVDQQTGDIYIPSARHNILVFPYGSNGDVAPARVLGGPDTQIRFDEQTVGSGGVRPIRTDPINNLLVVPTRGVGNDGPGLLIFDRNASGNTKPLRIIRGPKTQIAGGQQIAISPKGYIVGGATESSIGVWSVFDNGDVSPLEDSSSADDRTERQRNCA